MPPTLLPPVTVSVRTHRAVYARRGSGPGLLKKRLNANATKAVKNFGRKGEKYVKALAPVDTGYMKSQVGHDIQWAGKQAEVFVDGYVDLEIGAYYAVYVEYGTRNMRAQPFFWPGVHQAQREFVAEMRKVFR